MTHPEWFEKIKWSEPVCIEDLRKGRKQIPATSGVYLFSKHREPLVDQPKGVLYVGKADKEEGPTSSLRSRVSTYLTDPEKLAIVSSKSKEGEPPLLASRLKHAGKVMMLVEIQQLSRGGAPTNIWARWYEICSPRNLEGLLIAYLQPAFNTAP